jgi:hypothetical protein
MSVSEPVGAWPPQVRDTPVPAAIPAPTPAPLTTAVPQGQPDTGPIVTVTVTCVDDGHSHAVPDTELTSMTAGSGYYRAVCGHVVTAAPMVAPEGAPCRHCDEARETKVSPRARRLGLRLLGG